MTHNLIFSIFLIFAGAAVLSTLALITRQSTLVAYMFLGILLGPWGLKLIPDSTLVEKIGEVGIIFLLFLLGLHLPPQKLVSLLKKTSFIALSSSLIFAVTGYGVAYFIGLTQAECLIIGAAMMFSSTIIGIKLLPTTVLHHQHLGDLMISILLFQDLLAIIVLLALHAMTIGGNWLVDASLVLIGFPTLLAFAFLFEHFVLLKLLTRFNRIKEYTFLLAIGWCLSMAQLAVFLGLSHEIGAFIAGVTIASSPISFYIAESLKPVRDFFLVLFFFSVGASFNLQFFSAVIIPAVILTTVIMIVKPLTFHRLMRGMHETKKLSWETAVRLSQISEFSLIISFVASQERLIGEFAAYLIQAAAILSFIISSYWVVWKYPTPVALSDRLRRD